MTKASPWSDAAHLALPGSIPQNHPVNPVIIACTTLLHFVPTYQEIQIRGQAPLHFERQTRLDCSERNYTYTHALGTIHDHWQLTPKGWTIHRQWNLRLPREAQARLSLSLRPSPHFQGQPTLPAILYRGNTAGHGNRLLLKANSATYVREDRLAIPSAISVQTLDQRTPNQMTSFSLFTEPAVNEAQISNLKLVTQADGSVLEASIEFPWQEPGQRILSKGSFFPGTGTGPGYATWLRLPRGESHWERRFFLRASFHSRNSEDKTQPPPHPLWALVEHALESFNPAIQKKDKPPSSAPVGFSTTRSVLKFSLL